MARDGPEGLLHRNRGRKPGNALAEDLTEKTLQLSRTEYLRFNDTHFCQQLATAEGIRVSRETVRRLIAELEKAGIRHIDSANQYLQTHFLEAFNTQFGRPRL